MFAVSATFISTITSGSYSRVIVVQALDPVTLAVKSDLTPVVIDGTVEVRTREDIRRTLTITVANDGGTYTPRQTSDPFWINNPIRVYWRLQYQNGTTEDCPLGTFLVNRTRMRREGGRQVIDVDAVDFGKRMQYTKLLSVATYAAGSTLLAAFNDLLTRAGIPISSRDIDPQAATTTFHAAPAADLNFARGTSIADCFGVLAQDYGWTFGSDVLGTFLARPAIDPSTLPPVFTLAETDPMVVTVEGGYEDSLDVSNHVIVASTDASIQPVFAEVKDNNQDSPTYIGGSFGDRLFEYDANWVQTTAQALTAAQDILRRKIGDSRKVEIMTGPRPELDAFDIGTITAPILNVTASKYQIESMTVPLAGGLQRISMVEPRALP